MLPVRATLTDRDVETLMPVDASTLPTKKSAVAETLTLVVSPTVPVTVLVRENDWLFAVLFVYEYGPSRVFRESVCRMMLV
jgi:hypothetical protein